MEVLQCFINKNSYRLTFGVTSRTDFVIGCNGHLEENTLLFNDLEVNP